MRVPNPPLTLLIKPAAGLCNLRCAYCFYRAQREDAENRLMTAETLRALLDKIAAYAPAAVSVLFQGGEPTLAGLGFFRQFVAAAQTMLAAPVSYAIQTNGLLIDDAFASFFAEHDFLVGLSLDGDERTHDRSRRDDAGTGSYSRVLQAVETLRRHGVQFNILSVVNDENAADLHTTWESFRKMDFRFLQFIPCVGAGTGADLSAEAYARFLKESFDLWYADYTAGRYVSVRHIDNYIGILLGRPPENCAMRGVCGSYFVVEANGDLYPCDFYCTAAYKLGHISDPAPFAPSPRQQAFLRRSLAIHEKCRPCRYYLLCRGGCRRDRTADLLHNRYCEAYRAFFDYAAERMAEVAKSLSED